MTRPTDEQILAFLVGELSEDERLEMLDEIERSDELAAEVRQAAAGIAAMEGWRTRAAADEPAEPPRSAPVGHRVPAWWVPATVAATIALTIPATIALSTTSGPVEGGADRGASTGSAVEPLRTALSFDGAPRAPAPSFVVVLHGRWPDAGAVTQEEAGRRAREYWSWTSDLASRGLLVAAGDLRWEPGLRLAESGSVVDPSTDVVAQPDFLVGMLAVRASTYEEAQAIAEGCPHLDYGGSVSVRRVGAGFVTVPGMDDWSG